MLFLSKNRDINRLNLGMSVQFVSSSLIKSSDETLECESSRLSHVCLIKDGALRFCHIICEEEVLCNAYRLIFIEHLRCRYVSIGVHRM